MVRTSTLILAVLGCLSGLVNSECPNGWTVYENSCYYFGHTDLNFHDAQVFCQHYNATLVEIQSHAESVFLHSYLTDLKDPNHWIGLTDAIIEGEWRWYSDDTVATFTDWFGVEPNNGKVYNCAFIYGPYNYQWADTSCNLKYRPLCELNDTRPKPAPIVFTRASEKLK